MQTEQQITDQRGRVLQGLQCLIDTAEEARRDLTEEEQREYAGLEAELRSLNGILGESRAVGVVPHATTAAGPSADEERFADYVRGNIDGAEYRAQGVATGAAGGYLVPQGFRDHVTEVMKAYAPLRQVVEVITTTEGNDMPWPVVDDTANTGAILGENTQASELDVVFTQKTLRSYVYTSKVVRVSRQLLQDSGVNVDPLMARLLGERLARSQSAHFTTGTGTAQPEGVQTNAAIGKTGATGQTTSVIWNDLVDLVHSVDTAYWGPGASFMMNPATWGTVLKLRDDSGGAGLGRPLVEPAVTTEAARTLMGFPVVLNPDMPVMAANAKSILFGDFRAYYVIRDVAGFELTRLEERWADFYQVGFVGFQRSDGLVQDANAVKAYRNSAT
jgi:HK97 family phage major capsid protein